MKSVLKKISSSTTFAKKMSTLVPAFYTMSCPNMLMVIVETIRLVQR
jgi:hypothetical protein